MQRQIKIFSGLMLSFVSCQSLMAQQKEQLMIVESPEVKVVQVPKEKRVDIIIGGRPFTSFLYGDSIEKPVLYPLRTFNGTVVTRGFPLNPQPGDPTDHPHHLGLWFNFENVNGLDFWNNSYAIPKEKKSSYGWIKTDKIVETSGGDKGTLTYRAKWTNEQGDVLLNEATKYEFSGEGNLRIIDRTTKLTANTDVVFTDAKDGMLGLRPAHELQIPTKEDQKFTDNKGNVTIVKGGTDMVPNGNYVTSEGKQGNDAWSTRGRWCKVYGKMGNDSVSVTIIDHPKNVNYPTFWHARGYGLFAANPLGEKIFTNGKSEKNLHLKKGESVTFRFRIIIDEGARTVTTEQINRLANWFAAQ
jgi:hypothetical protein